MMSVPTGPTHYYDSNDRSDLTSNISIPDSIQAKPTGAAPGPAVVDGFPAQAAGPMDEDRSADTQGSINRIIKKAQRQQILEAYDALKARQPALTLPIASRALGIPKTSLWKLLQLRARGEPLTPQTHRCGRKPKFPKLTAQEIAQLAALYTRSNRTWDSGSRITALKFFALQDQVREEVRGPILQAVERGQVPGPLRPLFDRITPAHVAQYRRPKMTATEHMSGTVGAFMRDKIGRQRVIESDDGTLNFIACIPWDMGGDPCSDKYRVRVGRWQFLPAIECGWSHMYVGYAVVCRPRGSYRDEDIRSLIHMVGTAHGLPDRFRFERGTWESNAVVGLLRDLGVQLDTVYQSNQKPFVEGGFNKLWTYLSMFDGQVGRDRGDMETESRLLEKCRRGTTNPLDHFPRLDQVIRALDGAMAMHNSDTIDSVYGRWVPEVRHNQLQAERPWRQIPTELQYLFRPFVREWTVRKGSVGGDIPILEDYSAPFYFADDQLYHFNGHKVRLYFDPTAENCTATIIAMQEFCGFRPGDVITEAPLIDGLPHYTQAAMGWTDGAAAKVPQWRRAALAALRRDVRALDTRGRVAAASAQQNDGRGGAVRITSGITADPSTPTPAARPTEIRPRQSNPKHRGMFAAATEEEFQQNSRRFSSLLAAQRNNQEEQENA